MKFSLCFHLFIAFSFFVAASAFAQTDAVRDTATDATETELAPVMIGDQLLQSGPASSTRVNSKQIDQNKQTDVNRVLREAPGVYVQEEDAYGLRPNIGLRGVYPQRSKKIVFLEDGLLIGPAPYSAPAAYYTPNMSRVSEMNVYRGFSAVPYGPNSVGGAVEYRTREIPLKDPKRQVTLQGGTADFQRGNIEVGQREEWGGWLLVADHAQTAGFKKLDTGNPTGFDKNDLMGKLRWNIPGTEAHELDVKLAYSDEKSSETYLGLSDLDFEATPYRRYAATDQDLMRWTHQQVDITYRIPTASGEMTASVYSRWFWRDWRRFNGFMDGTRDVSEILRNPQGASEVYLDILRGRQDSSVIGGGGGDLAIVNNERFFTSQGILLRDKITGTIGESSDAKLDIALMLHKDSIDRQHTQDRVLMEEGRPKSSGQARQEITRNRDESLAKVVRVEGEVKTIEGFTVQGALRTEQVDYKKRDDLSGATSRLNEWAVLPGVGTSYEWGPDEVFLNVSQGATLRGPEAGTRQEKSVTAEIGLRHKGDFFFDATLFATRYESLKGACAFSSGCVNVALLDQSFDGGAANVKGIEALVGLKTDLGAWTFESKFNITLLDAKFADRFVSGNVEWGLGEIKAGDPLPYVPSSQVVYSFTAERGPFRQQWTFAWQNEMFDQSIETTRRTVEAHGVIDVSTVYAVTKQADLFLRVDNVIDNNYAVSYRPFGARPGKPRSFIAGLTYRF